MIYCVVVLLQFFDGILARGAFDLPSEPLVSACRTIIRCTKFMFLRGAGFTL